MIYSIEQILNILFCSEKTYCQHKFHFKMSPEHLSTSIDILSKEEKQLAKDCSQICFPASSTSALLSIRKKLGVNLTWTEEQVRYLTKKDKQVMYNLNQDATTAENLINSFASRSDVNYLYVTFHPNEGMVMLTGK